MILSAPQGEGLGSPTLLFHHHQPPDPEKITSFPQAQLGSKAQRRSRFPKGCKAQDDKGKYAAEKEVVTGLTESCRAWTRE